MNKIKKLRNRIGQKSGKAKEKAVSRFTGEAGAGEKIATVSRDHIYRFRGGACVTGPFHIPVAINWHTELITEIEGKMNINPNPIRVPINEIVKPGEIQISHKKRI